MSSKYNSERQGCLSVAECSIALNSLNVSVYLDLECVNDHESVTQTSAPISVGRLPWAKLR